MIASLTRPGRKTVSNKSFNDWRAFTAELLGKIKDEQGVELADRARDAIDQAISEVMNIIGPWHKTGLTEDLKFDKRELYRICTDAMQLAQLLRRQRALWSIRFPPRPSLPGEIGTAPLRFDPAIMKDDRLDEEDVNIEELRKCYVELIVTPVLYKCGTMNGELFDSEEAVIPAVVVMAAG